MINRSKYTTVDAAKNTYSKSKARGRGVTFVTVPKRGLVFARSKIKKLIFIVHKNNIRIGKLKRRGSF